MANTLQARKRARQADQHRLHNRSLRSAMRSSIKSFLKQLDEGDREAAGTAYRQATSSIDKLVTKGITHRNTAARLKGRLNNRLRALEG
ncbi:MAG: 30S ribosomal protein S20 [Gammaproteobacteria bacterium]|nr:30S ribosomal protein S20 [Gammaproteobacteria bacterium]